MSVRYLEAIAVEDHLVGAGRVLELNVLHLNLALSDTGAQAILPNSVNHRESARVLKFCVGLLQQISSGLSGSTCSIHFSSKKSRRIGRNIATVEKRYIAFGRQPPKSSDGLEKSSYLVVKS